MGVIVARIPRARKRGAARSDLKGVLTSIEGYLSQENRSITTKGGLDPEKRRLDGRGSKEMHKDHPAIPGLLGAIDRKRCFALNLDLSDCVRLGRSCV